MSSISLADHNSRDISVQQSPSGLTLFVTRRQKDGEHVLCLRSSDLREITKFKLNYTQATGSDSYFATVVEGQGKGNSYVRPEVDRELFIYGPITQDVESRKLVKVFAMTRPAWDLETRQSLISRDLPTKDRAFWSSFNVRSIDNDTVALTIGAQLKLLNLSGDTTYNFQARHGWVTAVTSCRGCDILAFLTYTIRGGLQLFDAAAIFPSREQEREIMLLNRRTHDTVEIPLARPIATVSALALSADGCALAHQADWELEVYRVCGEGIGRQLGLESMSR